MGQYINEINGSPLPAKNKAQFIQDNIPGTQVVSSPTNYQENLVCVVDNGPFEAAAYAYSEHEMQTFAREDGRSKTWLIVPGAKELAN